MQRQGIEAAEAALAAGEATAMLVLKAHDQRTAELCSAARDAGIPVHEVTERDMWRMAWPGSCCSTTRRPWLTIKTLVAWLPCSITTLLSGGCSRVVAS